MSLFHFLKNCFATYWFIWLSSTRRILMDDISAVDSMRIDSLRSAETFMLLLKGSVTLKVVPSPCLLVMDIFPPCNVVRFFVIERPNPVPPYLREVSALACVKLSKIFECRSSGTP